MKKQLGVTLIELMLVMAVGGAILLMGMNFYQSIQTQQYFRDLQANVDQIFLGMGKYYRANCRLQKTPEGLAVPGLGTLDPNTNNANIVPVSINQDLVNNGFLETAPIFNALVDPNDPASYIAQFNLTITSRSITPCFNLSNTVATQTCSNAMTAANLKNYIWTEQVAVKVIDQDNVQLYQRTLNATCTSTLAGNSVVPCNQSTGGPYLVWERLPSVRAPQLESSDWLLRPLIKEFLLQYTNDDFYVVSGASSSNTTNYYLCGG